MTSRKPLLFLAETKEPRDLSAAGFIVNWSVRQFRTSNYSSASRARTYNIPVNSRMLYH